MVLWTLIIYFMAMMVISVVTSRGADNRTYFTARRNSPWFVVATAMVGTSISGVTFVSVPGWVAQTGFSYLQMVMGFVVGYAVIAFVLLPLYYRMGLVSIYGYLSERLGGGSRLTGAWIFILSKLALTTVKMFLFTFTLQVVLFDSLGIPYGANVAGMMALIFLYTFRGGIKTLVWADFLQTLCLVAAVVLTIVFVAQELSLDFGGVVTTVFESKLSRIFVFDDWHSGQYFWKQFLAGAFIPIAMTGLDQDMMQKNLTCRNLRAAQKNVMTSAVMFLPVNLLFLSLGVLLYTYAAARGVEIVRGDELFPTLATAHLPAVVGMLFVVGLVASAWSSTGGAITSLTTSFTVDIVGVLEQGERRAKAIRIATHAAVCVVLAVLIYCFGAVNSRSTIDAIYTLVSYTYGPILGLFAFGIFTRLEPRRRLIPLIAVASPLICLGLTFVVGDYRFGYEMLIINGGLTFGLLAAASWRYVKI